MVEVLKYIHEHIAESMTAAEIAHRFGYSRWYFSEKFRQFTGRNFVEYVRHHRIQLAAIDILQGEKISDVAMNYGYESIGGFNKAFMSEYGCLAREYCKRAKESQLYYERRRMRMYQLTDRCEMLREEAMNRREYAKFYEVQREVYFSLGVARARKEGVCEAEVNAAGISTMLEKFTPVIIPGELVVGFNYGPNEIWYLKDIEEDWQKTRNAGVSEADFREYLNAADWAYDDMSLGADSPVWGKYQMPRVELSQREMEARREYSAFGNLCTSNHSVIGYEQVLKLGFEGLLRRVEEYEAQNGENGLYRGMKKICRAACRMGEKYAEEAEKLLENQHPDYVEADLRKIMEVCRNVPHRPAGSFREAVQALWFAHIINTWEDRINANSLGRLDQILYPYYRADMDKGILTREEAYELICCLWIKLYRDYDVQQSCVGGTATDGSSQVNDLSYMMLDATEQLNFIRCLSVRYSQRTEKEFLKRAMEVVGHVQKGVPFFFNDDVVIPALEKRGIAHEHACDYTQIGCVETVIPGRSNPHAVTGQCNILKSLEFVLNNGFSMMYPGNKLGRETGNLSAFSTFESFYEAVKMQMCHMLDMTCEQVRKHLDAQGSFFARPYKSLLTEGCVEMGVDYNMQGALYDYYQIMICGVPNLADSLMVVKKFIYEQRKYTLDQLKETLEKDFPDESVRAEFINKAPKFGNDLDEVDMIAADLIGYACDVLEDMSEKYGLAFHAQPFTFLWMLDYGRESAASPDGRRRGEILAYSVSPMQGRDFNGLTALFNSLAKIPTTRTPGTTSAIVEVDPKLFTDQNIDLLTEILRVSSEKGLNNVQFNTIDADTLIDAQKHPEKYNNLAVRVSGFSQKFNLLSPDLQNHIIGRTKHKCL